MFKHDFVCSSIKHNTWYEFKNHRWHECDAGHALRSRLSTDVSKKFLLVTSNFYAAAAAAVASDDKDAQKSFEEKGKKMSEIANKLKDGPFKDNIMRECRELFYKEKFEDKLDSRCHLIGFDNGVYDLEAMEFREGRPEDYISITTNINYTPYDPTHPYAQEMLAFINKVLTKDDIREYVLRVLSSFLNGAIREERFHIWTGSGANGKSKITELFESAFGEYCIKFPITLLTGKRAASNAPTAEVARSKGKRFACLQEPSEDEKLNVGLMKELSGGDKIQARPMFKDPIEFKPQFKMILNCNNLPTVPSDDGGTWRRIRVVEFTSKFVENPNPDIKTEFKMDTSISSRFDDWKEHFMGLLIEKYMLYIQEGIKEPEEVLQCTKEYQRNNDIYAEFVAQKLVKMDTEYVTVDDVYNDFKEWVKDNANGMKIGKSIMVKSLVKALGKTSVVRTKQIWKGYALVDHLTMTQDDTDF
jgi:P4 family phage/plasmid primase-like protien